MWGSRSRNRSRAEAALAAPVVDDVAETSLVPRNNLRARWEIGADGKLAMRWELVKPAAVTPLRLRALSSQDPARRTA